MKFGHGLLLAAVIAGAAFCQRAAADIVAYDNIYDSSQPSDTIQDWKGNLGLDFDVNTPISVTALGAFFGSDVSNLLNLSPNGVEVAIFDRNTMTQVGSPVTITPTNYTSIINADAFISLSTAISLPKGNYSVVSFLDPNFNEGFVGTVNNPTSTENSGGGALSFVGSGRFDSGSSLDYPVGTDGGPTNRYGAGTFEYNVVPVPGAVWGGLGLIGGLFVARKFRASIA